MDQGFNTSTIAGLEKLKVEEIVLYAGGIPVSDADVVSLFERTDIEIISGLLGGKVHGSLSRAGKVRGQTPKVENRILKCKRILNANPTDTFGRRRGPNSNST